MEGPFDVSFQHPCTAIVAGSTGSGKTKWIQKLIQYRDDMFSQKITNIIFCYGENQPSLFASMGKDVQFFHGITEDMISREKLAGKQTLLIIVDLQSEVNPKLITAIFSKYR